VVDIIRRIKRGLRDAALGEDVHPVALGEACGRVGDSRLEDAAPAVCRDDLAGVKEFRIGPVVHRRPERCDESVHGAATESLWRIARLCARVGEHDVLGARDPARLAVIQEVGPLQELERKRVSRQWGM
jgi:hypothetical protein